MNAVSQTPRPRGRHPYAGELPASGRAYAGRPFALICAAADVGSYAESGSDATDSDPLASPAGGSAASLIPDAGAGAASALLCGVGSSVAVGDAAVADAFRDRPRDVRAGAVGS